MNSPWAYTLTNAAPGHYTIHGQAYDDEGASSVTLRTFDVVDPPAPRIDSIALQTNQFVLQFQAAADVRLTLQRSASLPTGTWANVVFFAPQPVTRWLRVTNTLAPDSSGAFYRLMAGPRPE
jgi:hypothetical protein